MMRLLLLLLPLLGVLGEDQPSPEFCQAFCVQPGAMQTVARCGLCPQESQDRSSSREPEPSPVHRGRGDIRQPDYDDDTYIYDTDIQPVSGLETECEPEWCQANCENCGSDSPCIYRQQCDTTCPCPVITRNNVNMSVSCSTSKSVVEADLSSLLLLSPDLLSVNITLQDGDAQLETVTLEQTDLEEAQFSLEAGVCRGASLQVCLHISHPDLAHTDLKILCQPCTVSGPPHFRPRLVRISEEESGLTFLTLHWSPAEPTCQDTRYRVLLNGSKFDQSTNETHQKIGVAEKRLSPGVYGVSVLAENGDGDSEVQALTEGGLYTIHSLSPPELSSLQLQVSLDTEAHLTANISWSSDLSSPEGGYNVTVTNPDNSSADGFPRLLDWSTNNVQVVLAKSHPQASLRLQTFEQSIRSHFSTPLQIFRSLTVSSPLDLAVSHSVTSAGLTAHLTWTNGVRLRGSPVATVDLTTELEIWEDGVMADSRSLSLQRSSYSIKLSETSWRSEVRLLHSSSGNGDSSPPSPPLPLFSSLELSPPHNIKISFSFDQELIAVLSWDNQIDEKLAGVVKTVIHCEREEAESRAKRNVVRQLSLDYSQTETTLRLSELGWGSSISLQAVLGEVRGEQTERIPVFTEEVRDKYLTPPHNTQLSWEGEDDLVLSWTNTNTALVPAVVRLYHLSRLVREDIITQSDQTRYTVPYREISCQPGEPEQSHCQPWELSYSLVLQGSAEGSVVGLLDRLSLLPPDDLTVSCSELCHLAWCLPTSQLHLEGMGTILNFWNSSQVLESSLVERTDRCDNTSFPLPPLAGGMVEVSLQSTIPGYRTSQHSQKLQLQPSSLQLTAWTEDKLWLIIGIIGLSLLLLLYILGTVLCLRRLKNRGGYDIAAEPGSEPASKKQNFLVYSEVGRTTAQSDSGSRDTEQESIISEGCAGVLLPRVGSVATLGNFTEDDMFMGNFDEDGSFIGDYTQYRKEETQAVQNKLLEFAKMYNKAF